MKTKVIVTSDIHQEPLKRHDRGYIDGYVQGGDGRPYAIVVVGEKIGYAPIAQLMPIGLIEKS